MSLAFRFSAGGPGEGPAEAVRLTQRRPPNMPLI